MPGGGLRGSSRSSLLLGPQPVPLGLSSSPQRPGGPGGLGAPVGAAPRQLRSSPLLGDVRELLRQLSRSGVVPDLTSSQRPRLAGYSSTGRRPCSPTQVSVKHSKPRVLEQLGYIMVTRHHSCPNIKVHGRNKDQGTTCLTGVVGPFQRSPGGVCPLPSGGGLQLDDLRMSRLSVGRGGPCKSTERAGAGGSSSGREPSATNLLRMGPPKPPPAQPGQGYLP